MAASGSGGTATIVTMKARTGPENARDRFLSFEVIERLAHALAVDENQRAD